MTDDHDHDHDPDPDREHGQTYGEAVDEALEECADAVEAAEQEAERLREEGKTIEAFIIEGAAALLARDALGLARKRDRMPFGIESARGYGETMDNPALTFLEEQQREDDND